MTVTVKFIPSSDKPGKLADAEMHFLGQADIPPFPLEGMKLVGFAIWEPTKGRGRNVTYPSRQYSLNSERRSFSLLRPVADIAASNALRDYILAAYAEWEATR